jgi:hypothetical protein
MTTTWLTYTWELFRKYSKEYTKKDNSKWFEYNLNVWYKWTSVDIRTDEKTFNTLEDWKIYNLPVFIRTFLYWASKDQVWISYSIRKWVITDFETWEIVIEKN